MRFLCNSLTRWTFTRPHVIQRGLKQQQQQQQQVLTHQKFSSINNSQVPQSTKLYKCCDILQKRYLSIMSKTASHLSCYSKPDFYNKDGPKRFYSSSSDGTEDDDEESSHHMMVDIHMHEELLQEYNLRVLETQNVLVIQPYHKRGDLGNKSNTDKELMMMETLGLIHTLDWHVADSLYLGVEGYDRPGFFGPGQLDNLKELIDGFEKPTPEVHAQNSNTSRVNRAVFISAVFVSTYKLTSKQRKIMENVLQKPVLDRYNVVLQIFKRHARTKEARMQVELAELPYLRSRLIGDYEIELLSKHDASARKGEQYFDSQRASLARRERKLRNEIAAMSDQRSVLRRNKNRAHIPSIAVVGYTNSGKTSLIKKLTGTSKLKPKNKLFATLDVTNHGAKLPCNMNVNFLDTVGFISDVPTSLIASFHATLEDAVLADLLIHVRDVSHPDHVAQNDTVQFTLGNLEISQQMLDSMITVGNKIDLIEPQDWEAVKQDGMLPISTVKGYGLKQLVKLIEDKLISGTGRKRTILRVQTGGEEFKWLMQNVAVYDVESDPDNPNYTLLHSLLLDLELNQFKKFFVNERSHA